MQFCMSGQEKPDVAVLLNTEGKCFKTYMRVISHFHLS